MNKIIIIIMREREVKEGERGYTTCRGKEEKEGVLLLLLNYYYYHYYC